MDEFSDSSQGSCRTDLSSDVSRSLYSRSSRLLEAFSRRIRTSVPDRPPRSAEDDHNDDDNNSDAGGHPRERGPVYPWFGRTSGTHVDPYDPAGSALRLPPPCADDADVRAAASDGEGDGDGDEARERIRSALSERYRLRLLALRSVPSLCPPPRPVWVGADRAPTVAERAMGLYDAACDGQRRGKVRRLLRALTAGEGDGGDDGNGGGGKRRKKEGEDAAALPPASVSPEAVDAHSLRSDVETLEAARRGETSLFLSILSTLETDCGGGGAWDCGADGGAGTTSAGRMVRASHLAVPPGCVPPGTDAREFVLAAVRFLCQTLPPPFGPEPDAGADGAAAGDGGGGGGPVDFGLQTARDALPTLPLMRHVWPSDGGLALDLDRRVYAPAGKRWSVLLTGDAVVDAPAIDLRRRVLNLEAAFLHRAPPNNRHPMAWAGRERSCPRVGWDLETNIMLTGSITSRGIPASLPAKGVGRG